MRGIDLFCGAGGLSLGAEMAGIKIELAIEMNESAAETYSFNNPHVHLIKDDIRHIHLSDYPKKRPLIIIGGPPCQGFSISNTKTRNDKNSNNFLFLEFLRIISECKPDWFVFENVEGIASYNGGKTVVELKRRFTDLGYSTQERVLYASDYGVPQDRNRFFMVGNRFNIEFSFPPKFDFIVPVKEALVDLPDLKNGEMTFQLAYKEVELNDYIKLMRNNSEFSFQNFVTQNDPLTIKRYKYIKPGQNWKAIPKRLMKNYKNTANCHSGIYKRLDPEKPSVVIANYRKNMLIHPYENRGLSIREAARIQSFPDTFLFKGLFSHQQQQIGNAVPPLLAKALFSQILMEHKKYETKHQETPVEI